MRKLHEQVRELEKEMLILGSMVTDAIENSMKALIDLDINKATSVIKNDESINNKRWEIEEKALEVIATQQPVAIELRDIIAIIHITIELERIGDHAKGIAQIVKMHGRKPHAKPLIDLPRMAQIDKEMLIESLNAFKTRDIAKAREVIKKDNLVDKLNEQIFRELLTYMIDEPRIIKRAIYLTWVSHNLERIADRITNICERIIFLVTGKLLINESGANTGKD